MSHTIFFQSLRFENQTKAKSNYFQKQLKNKKLFKSLSKMFFTINKLKLYSESFCG